MQEPAFPYLCLIACSKQNPLTLNWHTYVTIIYPKAFINKLSKVSQPLIINSQKTQVVRLVLT